MTHGTWACNNATTQTCLSTYHDWSTICTSRNQLFFPVLIFAIHRCFNGMKKCRYGFYWGQNILHKPFPPQSHSNLRIQETREYWGIQENTKEYRRIQGNTREYRRMHRKCRGIQYKTNRRTETQGIFENYLQKIHFTHITYRANPDTAAHMPVGSDIPVLSTKWRITCKQALRMGYSEICLYGEPVCRLNGGQKWTIIEQKLSD